MGAPEIIATENGYRTAHAMKTLNFYEALYWSFITSMTVGYGEIVPHTAPARLLAVFDSLLGMTVMGVVAGIILSYVTPRRLPLRARLVCISSLLVVTLTPTLSRPRGVASKGDCRGRERENAGFLTPSPAIQISRSRLCRAGGRGSG